MDAVEVAARAGLEARPNARKPNAIANDANLMGSFRLVTRKSGLSNLFLVSNIVKRNYFISYGSVTISSVTEV